MTSYSFDSQYLQRLREGDPDIEQHFTAYFGELLFLKLRARRIPHQTAEDIRQETLLRVVRAVRQPGKIEHPERLAPYVLAVSRNVMLETLRTENRELAHLGEVPEAIDRRIDLDAPLVDEQRKRSVMRVMEELPERDQILLRMLFFEERDRKEICRILGVDADYLRILLFRAKTRFRAILKQK